MDQFQHQYQHQQLLLQQYQQLQSRFSTNNFNNTRSSFITQPQQKQIQNHNHNQSVHFQQQKQQKGVNKLVTQAELEMAYQDAWRISHPDIKRKFMSLDDACERLLPYHVVADYEAEEDDRILDSDTIGLLPSRFQEWDQNISEKVAEFTSIFEKQVLAFNVITCQLAMGEFRTEERLMIEQALLQEENHAFSNVRAELESRERESREAAEAKMRMAAMFQTEQICLEAQARAEMLARAPLRGSVVGSQTDEGSDGLGMGGQERSGHMVDMLHGWGNAKADDE